jgi:hypothetical protein
LGDSFYVPSFRFQLADLINAEAQRRRDAERNIKKAGIKYLVPGPGEERGLVEVLEDVSKPSAKKGTGTFCFEYKAK